MTKEDEFRLNVRREYDGFTIIDKFVNIKTVTETDGSFKQIALRTLLEKDTFEEGSSTAPMLINFGKAIADGEENYFVNKIITNIEKININQKSINKEVLIDFINSVKNSEDIVILTSFEFKYDVLVANGWVNYDRDLEDFILDIGNKKCFIYGVPNKIIQNHIIILNKSSIKWEYKLVEGTKERLDLIINHDAHPTKADIVARSIIKYDILDASKIKVIQIVE